MTFIHPTAVLYPNVEIGEGCYIGPFCVIGAPPELGAMSDGEKGLPGFGVKIGVGVRLEKAVVIDSGIENATAIGAYSVLMSGAHIGHDACISALVTIAPKAVIGGYAFVASEANIGMGALIHQKTFVRARCMIGMGAIITKAVSSRMMECETWAGNPAKKIGMNKKYAK